MQSLIMITRDLNKIQDVLVNRGIIGLPTETVYGIAGSAFSDEAIHKIYAIKNRPFENPLIVHLANKDQLSDLVIYIPDEIKILLDTFSPGPITFVLPKTDKVLDIVTAGKPNVAIRIPSHPVAHQLLKELEFPLVAPSANPFQRVSSVTAQQVEDYFSKENLLVLDGGQTNFGIESTIVGFENGKVTLYREGFITISQIENVINTTVVNKTQSKVVEAPGMYKKHYAPDCELIIAKDVLKETERWKDKRIGLMLLSLFNENNDALHYTIALSKEGNTGEALLNLYNALHTFEKEKIEVIITHLFPNDEYGNIINERILKASHK